MTKQTSIRNRVGRGKIEYIPPSKADLQQFLQEKAALIAARTGKHRKLSDQMFDLADFIYIAGIIYARRMNKKSRSRRQPR